MKEKFFSHVGQLTQRNGIALTSVKMQGQPEMKTISLLWGRKLFAKSASFEVGMGEAVVI